jgi:excisionase family DNA binding protein
MSMGQLPTSLSRHEERAQVGAQPSLLSPSLAVPLSEAARLLSFTKSHLYQVLRAGELEFFEDDGIRYITVASIDAYITRRGHFRETAADAASVVTPLAVPPSQAAGLLSLGLSRIYKLMRAGELQSFEAGRARRITVASIHEYISRIAASAGKWRGMNPQPPRRQQAAKPKAAAPPKRRTRTEQQQSLAG